jgi:hypothetical protein
VHIAIAQILLALIMLVRINRRPKLPVEHAEGYVVVPRTTPAVFDLDPRTDPIAADSAGTGDPAAPR